MSRRTKRKPSDSDLLNPRELLSIAVHQVLNPGEVLTVEYRDGNLVHTILPGSASLDFLSPKLFLYCCHLERRLLLSGLISVQILALWLTACIFMQVGWVNFIVGETVGEYLRSWWFCIFSFATCYYLSGLLSVRRKKSMFLSFRGDLFEMAKYENVMILDLMMTMRSDNRFTNLFWVMSEDSVVAEICRDQCDEKKPKKNADWASMRPYEMNNDLSH